jgi:hypothetical protein
MAFLRKDAAPPAKRLLEYLLSLEFQEFISRDGLICPAIPEAPLFTELIENQSRFIWSGWAAAADLGRQLASAQA